MKEISLVGTEKSARRVGRIPGALALLLLLCLSVPPTTVRAAPETPNSLTPRSIARTNPQTRAEQLSEEGFQLFRQGTAESLQQAIEKWEQALPPLREIGDKSGKSMIPSVIGRVYSDLGEKQKALEYYSQALALRRAVGDRRGEATTLNNIGTVYDGLGEKQVLPNLPGKKSLKASL